MKLFFLEKIDRQNHTYWNHLGDKQPQTKWNDSIIFLKKINYNSVVLYDDDGDED